jgi:phospholipid-binding lipoprotein MlaA
VSFRTVPLTAATAIAWLLAACASAAGPGAGVAPAAGVAAAEVAPATEADPLFGEAFDEQIAPPVNDPIEPVNRGVFGGNRWLDRAVIGPIARVYGWVLPRPVKQAVRNVFTNLNQPAVFVNDILQSEGKRAEVAGMRFIVNSTVGLGGLWDPAARLGLPPHEADFGQTLGKIGVGPGPYLVIPLLGPSTVRDSMASLFDVLLRPDTWVIPFAEQIVLGGTHGIAEREAHGPELAALERSSVDFYAAVRSAYLMNRQAMIRDDTTSHAPADRVAARPLPIEQQASADPLKPPLSPGPDR